MVKVGRRRKKKRGKNCQKFLQSFFTVAARLLNEGNHPSKVAKLLGISRQRLHYWLKKAVKANLFYKEKLGRITLYRLTDYGKKFFTGGEGRGGFGEVRLHNVEIGFPIVEDAKVRVDWRRVQLRNWAPLIGKIGEITVKKTTRNVFVYPRVRFDDNPWRAFLNAYEEALMVARVLEEKFGMRLGLPFISRKPHFGFQDPYAFHIAKHTQVSSDIGKIDQSEGQGEVEFFSPEHAAEYLAMPLRLRHIEERLDQITPILEKITQLFEKLTSPFYSKQKPGDDRYVA